MFRNNFKVALRNLVNNKLSAIVNIGGLAVGMAVALLIGIWIYDEFSYNKYHNHYKSIAEVKVHANYGGEVYTIDSHPMPLADALRSSYTNDFDAVVMSTASQMHLVVNGEHSFSAQGRFMEIGASEMLGLNLVRGSVHSLREPRSVLISNRLAKRLFGSVDPLGKSLKIDNKQSVNVEGVYEDIPNNDEFSDMEFLAPFDLYIQYNDWVKASRYDWAKQFVQIFVQLRDAKQIESINNKIRDLKLNYVSGEQAVRKPIVFLHPMSGWHLKSSFRNGKQVTSESMKYIWFYGTIGLFVLILACINFTNLNTARSEKRAKEVGIRKAVGSLRIQLIRQFFLESLLVAGFAFLFCLLLVQLFLPWFNGIAGKTMALPLLKPWFWFSAMIFIMITGLLAGIYPAIYLSAFRPAKVLKGPMRSGYKASIPRKVLVVVQFTVSIALIIGTLIVYRQIQFAKDRTPGYSQDNLLSLQLTAADYQGKYNLIRNEIMRSGIAASVAGSSSPITSIWSTSRNIQWREKDPSADMEFATLGVTRDYGMAVGWRLMEGRDYSGGLGTDSSGLVINETAMKKMGFKNAVGETIQRDGKNYTVLGVVNDMVMESPFQPSYPALFFLSPEMNCLYVKFRSGIATGKALPVFESIVKNIVPTAPLEYQFVDEAYASKFAVEQRVGSLALFFSILAIFISCMGIFGLASFIAERRIKEIGVRKVLGASVINIWALLSGEFVALVAIAFFIATPIAYYLMSQWLRNYEYRSSMALWIFIAAGAGALFITLFAASFHGIRAALMNPVKTLRSE